MRRRINVLLFFSQNDRTLSTKVQDKLLFRDMASKRDAFLVFVERNASIVFDNSTANRFYWGSSPTNRMKNLMIRFFQLPADGVAELEAETARCPVFLPSVKSKKQRPVTGLCHFFLRHWYPRNKHRVLYIRGDRSFLEWRDFLAQEYAKLDVNQKPLDSARKTTKQRLRKQCINLYVRLMLDNNYHTLQSHDKVTEKDSAETFPKNLTDPLIPEQKLETLNRIYHRFNELPEAERTALELEVFCRKFRKTRAPTSGNSSTHRNAKNKLSARPKSTNKNNLLLPGKVDRFRVFGTMIEWIGVSYVRAQSCPECHELHVSQANLLSHMKQVHPKSSPAPLADLPPSASRFTHHFLNHGWSVCLPKSFEKRVRLLSDVSGLNLPTMKYHRRIETPKNVIFFPTIGVTCPFCEEALLFRHESLFRDHLKAIHPRFDGLEWKITKNHLYANSDSPEEAVTKRNMPFDPTVFKFGVKSSRS